MKFVVLSLFGLCRITAILVLTLPSSLPPSFSPSYQKGKATGSILSKRMLIESVRVQSSLAFLHSLNLRETGIRTVCASFALVVK